jgi:hypothetical protein
MYYTARGVILAIIAHVHRPGTHPRLIADKISQDKLRHVAKSKNATVSPLFYDYPPVEPQAEENKCR